MRKQFRNNLLRDLARSESWQQSYRASKELKIELFNNSKNLSRLQIIFLSFLSFYDNIYTDIATGDCGLMNLDRVKDDILVDAYATAKRKKTNKDNNSDRPKINAKGIPSVSFVQK